VPSANGEEIVVTANRIPTALNRVASSTTLITAEDIQRKQLRSVADALRTVPGINVVASGPTGQQTSVFTRGSNSNHTLVLVDGIEVTDPSSPEGGVDFSNMWLDNVDRIEVVRGPQSTLYGSDAIGGVINIITRKGRGGPAVSSQLEGGTQDTFNQSFGISQGNNKHNLSASIMHVNTGNESVTPKRLRTSMFADNDGYKNWTASSRMGLALGGHSQLRFIGRLVNTDTELDPGLDEDPDARLEQEQFFVRAQLKTLPAAGWDLTVALSHVEYVRKFFNDRQDPTGTFERTRYSGEKLTFECQNDFHVSDNNTASLGVELQRQTMHAKGQAIFGSQFGDFILHQTSQAEAGTAALFWQDRFSVADSLFATAGVRIDEHDDFGRETTFRIAPVYILADTGIRLKASIGSGFKAPTLFQLHGSTSNSFGGLYTGNPALPPEKSLGWDVGLDHQRQKHISYGLTYFENTIKNLSQVVFDGFNSSYESINNAQTKGLEAFIALHINRFVSVRGDYTYVEAENADTGAALLRRPKQQFNLDVDYQANKRTRWFVGATVVEQLTDIARSDASIIDGDDYTVINLAGQYQASKHVSYFIRMQNVLDIAYEPADGFSAPGRAAFFGVRMETH